MAKKFWVLACLILPALSAGADYVIHETVESSGKTDAVTIDLKGDKCRVDTGNQTSTLVDPGQKLTTVLLHPQKMYLTLTLEQLSAEAEAVKRALTDKIPNAATSDFQPTGKTDIISGYSTEEYAGKVSGLDVSVWIAKDFPNAATITKALTAIQTAPGFDVFRSLEIPADKYPGLPLRTTVEFMGQRIVATINSVEETTLDDSLFTVPAGYQELHPRTSSGATPSASPSVTLSVTPQATPSASTSPTASPTRP
jgi:hypothetical protein